MEVKEEKKLGEVLIQLRLITEEQLRLSKIESAKTGKKLVEVLVDSKIVSQENLTKAAAISLNVPYIDLNTTKVDPNVLINIPKELAKKYTTVPFAFANGSLNIAMTDPNNVQVIEFVEKKSGMSVVPYLASEASIKKVIDQYQDASSELTEALQSVNLEPTLDLDKIDNIGEVVQDAPVTRAVNTILEYASKEKSSDIHIEAREKSIKVRYRIDGVLHEAMTLPVHIHAALVSRIKILANLKIDEHRLPQDGRFGIRIDDKEIDIRVSITPTMYGEKVVLRLLDKSGGLITLEELGLRGNSFRLIESGTKRPHGMVLSTGPTGSGKTTTLYAVLNKINNPEINITTLEDPVEYQVDGVNQIQVNSALGLTFASGLRSILRQDPDVIMVGEIRDTETAELAIQSALTGHTVLSTIHTNNAAGVLPRLLDMNVEPFLIASTVNTVIGQRLVRRICSKCKKSFEASPTLTAAIKKAVGQFLPTKEMSKKEVDDRGYQNLPFFEDEKITLYEGEGCEDCRNTGFQGRVGIYEVFGVSNEMEKLLLTHATPTEIQALAVKEGMVTMREDGFLKALEGITTVNEVISRITAE
ncbi:MAG: ATPase, T2SS/T4P/T4SS family [bacterium]